MLRLDRRSGPADRCLLSVQGEITAGWTQLLSDQCAAELVRVPASELTLDLAQVHYVDAVGRRLLRNLVALGVRLSNCRPLIQAQLDEEANRDKSS
jgi:anti-anti-sigma regulatory factor